MVAGLPSFTPVHGIGQTSPPSDMHFLKSGTHYYGKSRPSGFTISLFTDKIRFGILAVNELEQKA